MIWKIIQYGGIERGDFSSLDSAMRMLKIIVRVERTPCLLVGYTSDGRMIEMMIWD